MNKIIIADDSATARMVIRRCLEIAGCQGVEFVEAGNGLEVLEKLEDGVPDLLVTDLTMPAMDGTELVRRLKSQEQYKNLPVMVVSSAKNEAKVKELKGMGVFAVLPKPVSPAMIAKVLAPILPDKGGAAW